MLTARPSVHACPFDLWTLLTLIVILSFQLSWLKCGIVDVCSIELLGVWLFFFINLINITWFVSVEINNNASINVKKMAMWIHVIYTVVCCCWDLYRSDLIFMDRKLKSFSGYRFSYQLSNIRLYAFCGNGIFFSEFQKFYKYIEIPLKLNHCEKMITYCYSSNIWLCSV